MEKIFILESSVNELRDTAIEFVEKSTDNNDKLYYLAQKQAYLNVLKLIEIIKRNDTAN